MYFQDIFHIWKIYWYILYQFNVIFFYFFDFLIKKNINIFYVDSHIFTNKLDLFIWNWFLGILAKENIFYIIQIIIIIIVCLEKKSTQIQRGVHFVTLFYRQQSCAKPTFHFLFSLSVYKFTLPFGF